MVEISMQSTDGVNAKKKKIYIYIYIERKKMKKEKLEVINT